MNDIVCCFTRTPCRWTGKHRLSLFTIFVIIIIIIIITIIIIIIIKRPCLQLDTHAVSMESGSTTTPSASSPPPSRREQ